jgi:HEXXH motif-containing protein
MLLREAIHRFIRRPFPLWENELTALLVQQTGLLQNEYALPIAESWPLAHSSTYLEAPGIDPLANFYLEHGLAPCNTTELSAISALSKLESALRLIGSVKSALACVRQHVRSIQIVKSDDDEVDISYSHPGIAFAIFVSLCRDESTLSDIRVAESILHETMHLKLTLIENSVPLVKPDTGNLYHSPWREEKRPARGVLHGLFVFSAILDFYRVLGNPYASGITDHLQDRKEQITWEVEQLKHFYLCPDLTPDGAILTRNLLPSS